MQSLAPAHMVTPSIPRPHIQVHEIGTQPQVVGTKFGELCHVPPVLRPLQLLPVSWIPKQFPLLPLGHTAKYIPV